ncbi:CbrC family protein [Streptomyces albogriseolus]|uniref:CbrC family protein n=1 Tax=Streptomyces albogriseolus TaxID=1887 RepID=UPI003460F9C9
MPTFRCHPDPVATGSIRTSASRCVCCERSRGRIYTADIYTAHEVDGPFCPWGIESTPRPYLSSVTSRPRWAAMPVPCSSAARCAVLLSPMRTHTRNRVTFGGVCGAGPEVCRP